MSDDDIIMLWTLDGMECWNNISAKLVDLLAARIIRHHCRRNTPLRAFVVVYDDSLVGISMPHERYLTEKYSSIKIIYVIDDILSFNPDERWWKLLLAKHWYSKNKHRFSDAD